MVERFTWLGSLSIEILFAVGFLCGVQNVVGGAAYQVLLAQMAGRKRLVEANAKVALGETSAALIGPGLAGGLIHALTAPFAIVLDAITFFVSAIMLRRIVARNDVPNPSAGAGIWIEIGEGLKLVWQNRTLWGLAWLAGTRSSCHRCSSSRKLIAPLPRTIEIRLLVVPKSNPTTLIQSPP